MSSGVKHKTEGQKRILLTRFVIIRPFLPLLKLLGLDWTRIRGAARKAADAGHFAEARRLYELELEIGRKYSPNGILIAHSLNSLGLLAWRCGEYSQAEDLLLRALAMFEAQHNAQADTIATTMANLGLVYKDMGDYARAEAMFDKSLSLLGGIAQADARAIMKLNGLATVYIQQQRYAEAEELLEKMRELTEREYGQSHNYYALYQNNIGTVYGAQGRGYNAQRAFIMAIATYEEILGVRHPSVATPFENWAQMHLEEGCFSAAEPLLRRALSLREQTFGPDSPRLIIGLESLANLLRKTERVGEAETVEMRVRAIAAQNEGRKPDSN